MTSDDPTEVHTRFLEIADDFSKPLAEALEAVGPVTFPDRGLDAKGLGYFLSRAVIGQQLSTKAAASIWARVEATADTANTTIPHYFDQDCVEALRACGASGNKVKALQAIFQAEKEGLLDGETLRELDHDTRSQRLLAIWGIGQWTCDMASIFYCRCPDVWPQGDVTVQKTFARLIGRRKPAKAASRFMPYRSHLALAMWQIVDAPPQR